MTCKPVTALLAELDIIKSHSRPKVSNDNPYIEAQFKTLKYCPVFPEKFVSLDEAETFCHHFFDYYNHKDLDSKNLQDVKMTDAGRTVYGGGGISPDEKFTTPKFTPFQVQILSKFAFFNFSKRYFGSHEAKLPKNWSPDANIMN